MEADGRICDHIFDTLQHVARHWPGQIAQVLYQGYGAEAKLILEPATHPDLAKIGEGGVAIKINGTKAPPCWPKASKIQYTDEATKF